MGRISPDSGGHDDAGLDADHDVEPPRDSSPSDADHDATTRPDAELDGRVDTDIDPDLDPDLDPDPDPEDHLDPCEPIPSVAYGTLSIAGSPTDRPAALHGDINLGLRARRSVGATRDLVDITGPTDDRAPKLYAIYGDDEFHGIGEVFQVQGWDWGCNCAVDYMTEPEVQLAGLPLSPGAVIETPRAGYDIGDGRAALVLYADDDTITLKYTRDDNVVHGYTIHLAGICVEPELLDLYRACNEAGRGELPALLPDQPLGRARGDEVYVAIRDTGSWMDPRSRKDWW